MRDRLRSVECPKDIIDQIGGWSYGLVGDAITNLSQEGLAQSGPSQDDIDWRRVNQNPNANRA